MKSLPHALLNYPGRLKGAILRRIIPSIRRRFELESLVGPSGCWEQLQDCQLECLKASGLKPHHSLLDIGCGPLAGGQRFIEYLDSGAYVGVDIRTEPLKEAYAQIAEHGLMEKNPVLILSETFGKDELGSRMFDYVWVSQLTYHLDDAQTEELFRTVSTLLNPGGVFCCDVLLGGEHITDQSRWRGLSFYIRPLSFFEDIGLKYDLDMICLGQLAEFGYPQKVRLKNNMLIEFRIAAAIPLLSEQPQHSSAVASGAAT